MKRKIGFTLAEILITLSIIGVVTAITLPTVINRTQKQELVTRYKKFYSVISQAYILAQNSNGGTIEGLCNSNNDYITLFSKYIKNAKTCTTNEDNPYCFTSEFKTLTGRTISQDPGSTLTTIDGVNIIFLHSSSNCTGTGELKQPIGCARLRVDLNGNKQPNTVGYDIFDFYLTKKGVLPRGHEDTSISENNAEGWGKGPTILKNGKIDY